MTILFSLKFWSVFQLFIDLVLGGLFLVLLARLKNHSKGEKIREKEAVEKIVEQDNAFDEIEGIIPEKNTMGENFLAAQEAAQEAGQTASRIIDMLEPLVREADAAAVTFDGQIRDKKRLIQGLNNSLDSRIISINLLLSRAESLLSGKSGHSSIQDREMVLSGKDEGKALKYPDEDVFDQQKSVVDLFEKGFDVDAIAQRLSMPKGEVQLVISLKKKFTAMEAR